MDFDFDKFMDEIEEFEKAKEKRHEKYVEDTPQQAYQKRYKELSQNRIVWKVQK
jgi:hypothetical protein